MDLMVNYVIIDDAPCGNQLLVTDIWNVCTF